jgi:capsular polysaccharide export protein
MPVVRRFLLLQGVCSPFFSHLGTSLMQRGHSVYKLNFSMGDVIYWRHPRAWAYRQRLEKLEHYARDKIIGAGITDVVLFGDKRPVHENVRRAAEACGARVHVFEEGYFRPHWITLERGGVNGQSQLPRDPDFYRAVGPRMPAVGNGASYPAPLWRRALHDVAYHAAGILNKAVFPSYRSHVPWPISKEYANYVLRGGRILLRRGADMSRLLFLLGEEHPFFLFPLQLGSDAQIRHHSGFENMKAAVEYVLRSFTEYADSDTQLVIKNHPLDCGIEGYDAHVRQCAASLGVGDRVHFLESGHLPALLTHARGVVTVNSTVGGSALVHRKPLKALGQAIYDIPGLTFQGHLDDFWKSDFKPDSRLARYFRNTVIHATQINGGFYTRDGIAAAVEQAVPRLEAVYSPVEKLIKEFG